jgi:hypothetical protein
MAPSDVTMSLSGAGAAARLPLVPDMVPRLALDPQRVADGQGGLLPLHAEPDVKARA